MKYDWDTSSLKNWVRAIYGRLLHLHQQRSVRPRVIGLRKLIMEAYTVAFVVKKDTIECSQKKKCRALLVPSPIYRKADQVVPAEGEVHIQYLRLFLLLLLLLLRPYPPQPRTEKLQGTVGTRKSIDERKKQSSARGDGATNTLGNAGDSNTSVEPAAAAAVAALAAA